MINLYYLLFAAFLLPTATIQAQLTVSDARECLAQLDYSAQHPFPVDAAAQKHLAGGI
jgi:hypothetical protein